MRVCLVEMLRTQYDRTGFMISSDIKLYRNVATEYWLHLVLDQINILSGLFLQEFRPQITVVAMTRKELKYCCGPVCFYLNER